MRILNSRPEWVRWSAGGVLALCLIVGNACGFWLVTNLVLIPLLAAWGRWWMPVAATTATPAPAAPGPAPAAEEPAAPVKVPVDQEDLAEQMLYANRFALLLRPMIAGSIAGEQLTSAQEALDATMSIVPAGRVRISAADFDSNDHDEVTIGAFHLDRFPVTNKLFQQFVDDGGYQQMAVWEQTAWPAVIDFVDATGQPGPRFWRDGRFVKGTGNQPVVGISWFEADAYARWAGKRLCTDAEWVKAAGWPVMTDGKGIVQRTYPWGDTFDASKANLWSSGHEKVVDVDHYSGGASVGGVYQLVGNVWEWTSTPFGQEASLTLPHAMRSIRGGAFDTYFDTQASCTFCSGDNPLARKHNIGFRCALSVSEAVSAYSGLEPDVDMADEPEEQAEEDAVLAV